MSVKDRTLRIGEGRLYRGQVVVSPPSTPPSSANLRATVGVTVGQYAATGSTLSNWATAHGVNVTYVQQPLGKGDDAGGNAWQTFYPGSAGVYTPWTSSNIGSKILVISVPLAYNGTTNNVSLQQAATGGADGIWSAMLAYANSGGLTASQIIWRPGWEFDGNWYRWAINSTWDGGTVAQRCTWYRQAYQRFTNLARATFPGAKTCWCGDNALFANNYNIIASDGGTPYPGDSYVDYIGIDEYEKGYGVGTSQSARDLFWDRECRPDLIAAMNFTVAHGKKFAFPEWAVVKILTANDTGGGDDVSWIQRNLAALRDGMVQSNGNADRNGLVIAPGLVPISGYNATTHLGFHCYYEVVISGIDFTLASAPNAALEFNKELAPT